MAWVVNKEPLDEEQIFRHGLPQPTSSNSPANTFRAFARNVLRFQQDDDAAAAQQDASEFLIQVLNYLCSKDRRGVDARLRRNRNPNAASAFAGEPSEIGNLFDEEFVVINTLETIVGVTPLAPVLRTFRYNEHDPNPTERSPGGCLVMSTTIAWSEHTNAGDS